MFGLRTPVSIIAKDHFWYEYSQNNSGGHFDIDDDVSICVLIQAEDKHSANRKAEEIGIYFDGCMSGLDCDCCGDRWHKAHDEIEEFSVYSWNAAKGNGRRKVYDNILDYAQAIANEDSWAGKQHSVIVYFANDSKTKFWNSNK